MMLLFYHTLSNYTMLKNNKLQLVCFGFLCILRQLSTAQRQTEETRAKFIFRTGLRAYFSGLSSTSLFFVSEVLWK